MQAIYQWFITDHFHHHFMPAIYLNLLSVTIAVLSIISLYRQIREKQRPVWLHVMVITGCAFFIWQYFF
jgi:hypothetical protein